MKELTVIEMCNVDGGSWSAVGQVAGRIVLGAAVGTGAGLIIGLAAYVAYEALT